MFSSMVGNDDDDADVSKAKTSAWKPQVHFVWDMLLDEVLSSDAAQSSEKSFPEFFRILVDGQCALLLPRSMC